LVREHLIAGTQLERASDDGEGDGHILGEDHILRAGAQITAQRLARRLHQPVMTAIQKLTGLSLQLALPVLVGIEHRPRRCAVGAVIKIRDRRVEEEEVF
jgi:hypothetical protein